MVDLEACFRLGREAGEAMNKGKFGTYRAKVEAARRLVNAAENEQGARGYSSFVAGYRQALRTEQ